MAIEPGTIAAAVNIAKTIIPFIGGLFKDKDYPWAQGTININNGRARREIVQTLDGANSAEWNTLTNLLVEQINAQFAEQGLLDERGVTLSHISIGQASGRPGSKLGTGFYVAIPGGTFNEGAPNGLTSLQSIEEAIGAFFTILNQNLTGVPQGYDILSDVSPISETIQASSIAKATDSISSDVLTTIGELSANVDSLIANSTRQNESFLDQTIQILSSGINAITGASDTIIRNAIDSILSVVIPAVEASELAERDALERVASAAEQSIAMGDIASREMNETIQQSVQGIDTAALSAIDNIERVAVEGLEAQITREQEFARTFEDEYVGFVETQTPQTPDIFDPARMAGILSRIPKGTPQAIAVAGLASLLWQFFGGEKDTSGAEGEAKGEDKDPKRTDDQLGLRDALKFAGDLIDLGDLGCESLNAIDKDSPATVSQFARLLFNFFAIIAYVMTRSGREAEACLLEWNETNPFLPMSPGDSALAWHRDLITTDKALKNIKQAGFNADDADVMLAISETYPDLGLLLTMWFRDLITDDVLEQALLGKGIKSDFVPKIKEAAFFIPPVQDIIQFAVKEVFNPVVAAQFGQFEEFPEEFADLAKQQGVSREFAEYYWAAHWALPSIQMGYEMFHRRIIDRQKLENLFIALDIMPGWRNDLVEMSYSPLTRVDVRRMNKLGVITSEEVYEAYLDLGYSPKNAERLQRFVQDYNFPEETLQEQLANDLTRSNIISFYRNGIIDRVTASLLLTNAGINAIAAALFLDDADFKEELEDRKAEQAVIIESAKIGNITIEEARAQLDTLGLETAERDKALVKLERVIQANVKQPSKADLDKFLKNELITEDEYRTNMRRLGYSNFWIDKYIQLIAIGETSGEEQS